MEKMKPKEWIKKYRWTILAVLIVLGVLFAKKGLFGNVLAIDCNDTDVATQQLNISTNEVKQYLEVKGNISSFCLYMVNKGESQDTVTLSVYDGKTNELIQQADSVIANTGDEAMVYFNIQINDLSEGQIIYYAVSGGENTYLCVSQGTYTDTCIDNGTNFSGRVRYVVTYGSSKDWPAFLLTLVICMLAVGLLTYTSEKKIPVFQLFLILAISGGLMFAYINPAGQECDGWEHILRSIDVSYGNVLNPIISLTHESGEILVPDNINEIGFKQINENNGVAYVENLKQLHFSSELTDMTYDSSFVSIFYWPQGLGMAIGRLLGFSVFYIIFLGRVMNLMVYAILAALAIKLTPIMKNLFMVVALLPMTLYQAASCSPDALLVGLCLLFTAVCFYYAYGEIEELKVKHVLALGGLLTLIFLCKYVYVCMGLLVFLIPTQKFKSKIQYWKSFVIGILPLVVTGILMMSLMMSSVALMQSGTDGMTQTQYVMNNPIVYAKLLIRTVAEQFSEYVLRLDVLGWLSYSLGPLIVIVPSFLVGVAILDTEKPFNQVKTWHKWLGLATFGIVVALTLTGLYVGDGRINPFGATTIQGFQGRYFIPIMIPGLMLLSSVKVQNNINNFSYKVAGWLGVFLGFSALVLRSSCY